MSAIIDRILADIGDADILDKLLALPKADLNSLLLELMRRQTSGLAPVDMLRSYQTNRFAEPSIADPAAFHALEARLLRHAQSLDIKTPMLSPSAPLGSCSAFGYVDQNNVISALRGTETLSDPSNMLAIIIADKLKRREEDNKTPLHYATTSRVVRAQAFSGKGFYSHFGLFCMVSSGLDVGSYLCEKELLSKHLEFYKQMIVEEFQSALSITLRKRGGYTDIDGFFGQMTDYIREIFPDTPLDFDLDNTENKYYLGINFKIYMDTPEGKIEIGDGGFVDWTQQMLGSKKQRCLISGIGLDRLLLFGE